MLYLSADKTRNMVEMVVGWDLKGKIINVGRIKDEITSIKPTLYKQIVQIFSMYALQVGLDR